jgi:TolB-like protein/Tfp pilus assembly protein PilF
MTGPSRRLAAILAADVAGYSRLMGADEEGTLARLKAHRRELIDPRIAEHRGRIVKTTGDGLLVEFGSVVDAVRCAAEIQRAMTARESDEAKDGRIQFRIGVNLGDVIVDGDDIHGDGVNVAARLESIADPGSICLSAAAWEQVRGKIALAADDIGEQRLKNIDRAVGVYRIAPQASVERPALPLPDKPSIAVLPFQNMSGDPGQEYFSDGISEDIITALSRLRGFFVIARNPSFTYKGRSVDAKQIGRELGIRYLVEGSVRKSGNRVRITTQLSDTTNAAQIWAERYDRDLADIFSVQDEIAESVVASIEPELYAAENLRSRRKAPANLDAWDLVMRAMSHLGRYTADDFHAAQVFLEQAVERDPRYARAHALLGWTKARLVWSGWGGDPGANYPAALDLAKKALALDSDDPWTHLVLGWVQVVMRRPADAVAALSKAVELNPNFAYGHACFGWTLAAAGRSDDAIRHIDRALRISPRDTHMHVFVAFYAIALMSAGRYREAADWLRRAVQDRPGAAVSYRALVANAALAGDIEGARSALAELQRLHPGISLAWLEANVPYEEPLRGRYVEGFRLAGLR